MNAFPVNRYASVFIAALAVGSFSMFSGLIPRSVIAHSEITFLFETYRPVRSVNKPSSLFVCNCIRGLSRVDLAFLRNGLHTKAKDCIIKLVK